MKIIKRNGNEVEYDARRIYNAVNGANKEALDKDKLLPSQITVIEEKVRLTLEKLERAASVEEIQDLVIYEIMKQQAYAVAQLYTEYRYKQALKRVKNTTDDSILSIIACENEDITQENSNKNPIIESTQRDYIAGEVSKDLTFRTLLPPEITEAHKKGIIHFHDSDYFLQTIHNCSLINMKDILNNGTVISEKMITSPKSFWTACNITTQVVAQVASNQFGGQTFSLSDLVPFVDVTRQKLKENIREEGKDIGISYTEEQIDVIAETRLKSEIKSGIQTIQYQLLTLMTTNGQTPFVSMYMDINDVEDDQKDDMAMLIEEVLNQRIRGIQNEKGIWVTPAFPKLLYVLDENNIKEGEPYFYLTQLAAKCSAKRLTPDYISAKVMRELKDGDTYPCMGCVDGKSVIDYKIGTVRYVESFERAWLRLSDLYVVKTQPNGQDVYMDTPDVTIWDNVEQKYVAQKRIIRNTQSDWYKVGFTGGRYIHVTNNHPFEIENKGVVLADDLMIGDSIKRQVAEEQSKGKCSRNEKVWLKGLILCDGSYDGQVNISLGLDESEIVQHAMNILKSEYNLDSYTKDWHRGKRGNYTEMRVNKSSAFGQELKREFGGLRKKNRQIPNDIFNGTREEKLSFLAGMIDADGYINNANNTMRVQLGSTNEELALQQMALAIDLGINAAIYPNRYKKASKKLRYRVEFNCTSELSEYIVCDKKAAHFNEDHNFYKNTVTSSDVCEVKSIEPYYETKYSYDVTTESEHFTVNGIYSHNCRSFLTPDRFTKTKGNIAGAGDFDPNGHKYFGRFNQGVVTLNLVDVACSSGKDMDAFWKILDERLELCHRALRLRHERLLGTKTDVAPILWQHGALARLPKGAVIDPLLYDGYSTLSLGYAGLYEMCKHMTGVSHTDEAGKPFALAVMQKMNDKCNEWKAAENIDYSIYGTPLESTTYKFAKCLQNRFGKIEGVTDHNYITNSYHVNVREEIDAFTKLSFESEFQKLSPGGAISYVEIPNMQNNLPAVIAIIQHIYENIMYAELNTKSDYCQVCGYDGEIQIVEDDHGKLIWECPNCGNRDQSTMDVARRTCGYIGTQFWNQGRTQEIKDRVIHVS